MTAGGEALLSAAGIGASERVGSEAAKRGVASAPHLRAPAGESSPALRTVRNRLQPRRAWRRAPRQGSARRRARSLHESAAPAAARPPGSSRMHHHFTVDVEEWFQVHALEPYVARAQWDRLPSRVEGAARALLELLAEHAATGTFFTLGWIAELHPRLVRDIAAAGHEVASHGWGHEKVGDLSPARF